MNLAKLKVEVFEANLELVKRNLVIYTWGNVSAIDRESGLVVIKPRGVEYDKLTPASMSVVDFSGNLIEGDLLPSVDLDIHLEIYKAFDSVGAIAHTHSTFATAFAQSLKEISVQGTTHADHFYGSIPCLTYLSKEETERDYERNLGRQIVKHFKDNEISPMEMCAVLAGGHGPFTWGKTSADAVSHSVILEEMAKMAVLTKNLAMSEKVIPKHMLDKHYLRKYGKKAYFYQDKK